MNIFKKILSCRYITATFLAAICFFLGLYRLDYQSIWLDEFTTLQVSQTLESVIGYCRAFPEQHPLYYLLVYATGAYQNIFTIRLLSLVCGAGTVFPLFLLSRKLVSEHVALLSTLFFSLSPFILYYNQEGRMYTLLMFLAVMQVNFFIDWYRNNGKKGLTGFVIFSVLCLYTHFFALFLIISEAAFLMNVMKGADKSIGLRKAVIVFFSLGLFYLPWAIFMAQNLGQNAQTWKGIKHIFFGAPYTFFRFIYGYAVFPLNFDKKLNFSASMWQVSLWVGIIIIAFIPALIILKKSRIFTGESKLIPILGFVPMALSLFFSLYKNMIGERYLVFSAPFFFIVISVIAVKAWPTRKSLAVLAFVLPFSLSLFGLIEYFANDEFGKINMRAAAQYIINKSPSNALVLCHPAYAIQGPVDYYLKGARSILPLYNWDGTGGESEVWVLEEIFSSIPPGNLEPFGYRKIGETVWNQENGLRLTIWKKG
jgi:uncharacterized membrane protein